MTKNQRVAIKKAIKDYTAKATRSSATARETLVKEGIYRKDGKLAPQYRASRKTA